MALLVILLRNYLHSLSPYLIYYLSLLIFKNNDIFYFLLIIKCIFKKRFKILPEAKQFGNCHPKNAKNSVSFTVSLETPKVRNIY